MPYSVAMSEADSRVPNFNLQLDIKDVGGCWANFATVKHTKYEFTIDFARLDFAENGDAQGVVVSRVNLSPLFVAELIDALQKNWHNYSQKSLPPEVRD